MSSWFINFCAPFIPNDPTINFHRTLQVALLLIYTLFYAAVHFYYIYCSPLPITSDPPQEGTPITMQNNPMSRVKMKHPRKVHRIRRNTKKYLLNWSSNPMTRASSSKKLTPHGTKPTTEAVAQTLLSFKA
jgi:hypothetical protein